MTYNIYEGAIGREEALLATIRAARPDLLFLQEVVDRASARHFAESLHMHLCFAESNARTRNVGLLSHYPLLTCESYHPFPLLRTLLLAAIEVPGGVRLNLFGIHLGILHDLWRTYELAVILRRIRQYEQGYPSPYSLLAGDFNAILPGDRVGPNGGLRLQRAVLALQFAYSPRLAPRLIAQAAYVDCFRHCHATADGFTFPSDHPAVRLDYLFASPALAARLRNCVVRDEPPPVRRVSDHLPLLAEFDLAGSWE